MSIRSETMENSQTLLWEGDAAWNHVDAVKNNTFSQSGILTGDGSAPGYDFNNGAQGWTFSNSYSGRVTRHRVDTTARVEDRFEPMQVRHATSPATNLAGRTNIPFHAWVHEGRSGCGETPDSGENLQFKYKTAGGQWTTFTPSKVVVHKPAISSIRRSCLPRRSTQHHNSASNKPLVAGPAAITGLLMTSKWSSLH